MAYTVSESLNGDVSLLLRAAGAEWSVAGAGTVGKILRVKTGTGASGSEQGVGIAGDLNISGAVNGVSLTGGCITACNATLTGGLYLGGGQQVIAPDGTFSFATGSIGGQHLAPGAVTADKLELTRLDIGGPLVVCGSPVIDADRNLLNVSRLHMDGPLLVGGCQVLGGPLLVHGDQVLDGALLVGGCQVLNGPLLVGGCQVLNGPLFVHGQQVLDGPLSVGGCQVLNGPLFVHGQQVLGGPLWVGGCQVVEGPLFVHGQQVLDGPLWVGGCQVLDSARNLHVSTVATAGPAVFGGEVRATGPLVVGGAPVISDGGDVVSSLRQLVCAMVPDITTVSALNTLARFRWDATSAISSGGVGASCVAADQYSVIAPFPGLWHVHVNVAFGSENATGYLVILKGLSTVEATADLGSIVLYDFVGHRAGAAAGSAVVYLDQGESLVCGFIKTGEPVVTFPSATKKKMCFMALSLLCRGR